MLRTVADRLLATANRTGDLTQENKLRIDELLANLESGTWSIGDNCQAIPEETDSKQLGELFDTIARTNASVNEIIARCDGLRDDVANDIAVLNEDITVQQTDIDASRELVDSLRTSLMDTIKELGVIQGHIAKHGNTLKRLESLLTTTERIDNVDTRLQNLAEELTAAYSDIAQMKQGIQEAATTTVRLGEWQDHIDAVIRGTDYRMTVIEGKVGVCDAAIAEANEKAEKNETDILSTVAKVADIEGKVTALSNLDHAEYLNGIAEQVDNHTGNIAENAAAISTNRREIITISNSLVRTNELAAANSAAIAAASPDLNTLFNKASPFCSTVMMAFDQYGSVSGGLYSGSGCFITLADSDLQHGLFLTCAHNIIRDASGAVQRASAVYIENPANNTWFSVPASSIFLDGVGDIALIKTGIDLRGLANKPLRLAAEPAKTGDRCVMIGDPGSMDSDSMTAGIVRSARYEMKPIAYQINECLHVDASSIGGNSGSPIMTVYGDIIGMLTYGAGDHETLGGGPNLNSLKASLSVLSQFKNNLQKKYLGLVWGFVYPTTLFQMKSINPKFIPSTAGVEVYQVSQLSPFLGKVNVGDIIVSVITYNAARAKLNKYNIGTHEDETPLGVLLYAYSAASAQVTVVSRNTATLKTVTVPLTKTYADVPAIYDMPLTTGLRAPIKKPEL